MADDAIDDRAPLTQPAWVERLHADLSALREEIRRMAEALDRRAAVDQAWAAALHRVIGLLDGPAMRAPVPTALSVLLLRVALGPAADALIERVLALVVGASSVL